MNITYYLVPNKRSPLSSRTLDLSLRHEKKSRRTPTLLSPLFGLSSPAHFLSTPGMCLGRILVRWCACKGDPESHPLNPIPTGWPREAHTIMWSTDSGAYSWCDAYLLSKNFQLEVQGRPNCPDMVIYQTVNLESRRICEGCCKRGCNNTVRRRETGCREGEARW
ncbi:hypothetical protein B0T22DRAFT_34084 [Podospora appendiculata]|uniref:Uncharacterized protein n=1 Tax=Podospora appendiculata TaxID=314037 RepID=A0AAE0XGP0_9PEZI|nr:hypothetical protein B0T22DRAFT_34084 [Podospora appendiculata]